MTECPWNYEDPLDLPDDLRQWLEPKALIELAFDAVHGVLDQPNQSALLPLGTPRVLLTVLTYSYAVGVYASESIEARVLSDPELLYLTGKAYPSASTLRQFRRRHHGLLQQSLAKLVELTWKATAQGGSVPSKASNSVSGVSLESVFAWAAEHRIRLAILADTMAMDN